MKLFNWQWFFPLHLYQTNVAAAVIGGAVIGGGISAVASNSAANKQVGAANSAQASQERMFNTVNEQQAPWRQAGTTALKTMTAGTAPGGQFTHQFNADDLKTGLAPNYDFMLGQGLGAVNNSASVTGGLVGGNALKGINDYAQNYASNGYQNAFNNYNTNQTNIFNRLSSIAGLGQTANGQTATAGTTLAGNIGSAQMAGGAAAASGIVGGANAINGGLNNAMGWYMSSNPSGISNSQVATSHADEMARLNNQAALGG